MSFTEFTPCFSPLSLVPADGLAVVVVVAVVVHHNHIFLETVGIFF